MITNEEIERSVKIRPRLTFTARGQFHQQVYKQLLCAQILKAQKLLELTVFLVLLESGHVKAEHKMLVKLTPCYHPSGTPGLD